MSNTLQIAVAQPRSRLLDVGENVERHAVAIRDIEARVVLFPELSLTGYSMQAQPIEPNDPRLSPVVEACAATNAVALVGAPTRSVDGGLSISTLRVDGSGVSVAYNKMFLGGDEPQHFRPGDEPAAIEIDGWRLGLAICKDTGVPEHAAQTAALGIDVYAAAVCETESDRDVQTTRAAHVINDHAVWVACASFAGPTGGGFEDTAGRSAIWRPDGRTALRLGRSAGQTAMTTLTTW